MSIRMFLSGMEVVKRVVRVAQVIVVVVVVAPQTSIIHLGFLVFL